MRKGIITNINPALGRGYIEDENEQDITYLLNPTNSHIAIYSTVSFDIILEDSGLMASKITLISAPLANESNNIHMALNSLSSDIKETYNFLQDIV